MTTRTHPYAVTAKEIATAQKMASRQAGVTRQQLAEKLGINVRRAKTVIERASLKGTPLGALGGKMARTIVFRAKA